MAQIPSLALMSAPCDRRQRQDQEGRSNSGKQANSLRGAGAGLYPRETKGQTFSFSCVIMSMLPSCYSTYSASEVLLATGPLLKIIHQLFRDERRRWGGSEGGGGAGMYSVSDVSQGLCPWTQLWSFCNRSVFTTVWIAIAVNTRQQTPQLCIWEEGQRQGLRGCLLVEF